MLRKVLIGIAVLVVLGVGVAGFEAYRLYNSAQGIFGLKHPTAPSCSSQVGGAFASYPKLLAWTNASATTSTLGASRKKLKVCLVAQNQDPTLSGKNRINILLLGTDT